MSIDSRQLRKLIVRPALNELGVYSAAIENLLLGTAAQESLIGRWLAQTRGTALGIYQVEPRTHTDIYINYILGKRNKLMHVLDTMAVNKWFWRDREEELIYNLKYATAIAYIVYERATDPLPTDKKDIDYMAKLWKKWYNTPQGAGTVDEFKRNYRRLVK